MKLIQAVGVEADPDAAWLESELRARGIVPVWNSDSVESADVVLLCVSENLDFGRLSESQKSALYKYWERRVLIVVFDWRAIPGCLADIMALDFANDRPGSLEKLIGAIDRFVA
jgi:hypothetical protein